jgi:putative acetyltransferase
VIVRPERSADFAAIRALVQAAFDSPVEPKLVDDLRGSPGYLPELALVAEDEEPVGHVTITELESGTPILMLSPLAVRPDRQREGVGSALVEEGLRRARERQEPVVVVEGDPRY